MLAVAIVSDNGDNETVTLVGASHCYGDIRRIMTSPNCKYRVIKANTDSTVELLDRVAKGAELMDKVAKSIA